MPVIRQTEIMQRRNRKAKMKKLRERYKEAKTSTEREAVLAKAARVAPWVTQEEFLAVIKK